MRIIPKKIKVKNTVWKCYSMTDVVVALFVFALIFIAVTAGNWAIAIIMGLIAVVMFMPTPDGIFYTCIFENVKFLFAKKRYTADAKNPKENIDTLLGLKEIRTNGLLAYNGGMYGRVIKVGQKNFGIEDVVQQNIDIGYIANALKLLDANQSADIIKIDRPVNLDGFAKDIFDKLSALRESGEYSDVKDIRRGILQERIDRIDKLNNIRKQYLSDYYIVVYGRSEVCFGQVFGHLERAVNVKDGCRPYRLRFSEPVCQQEQYGGERADAAYLPFYRTGSHQRKGEEQGRSKPAYAHHCGRGAPLHRPEVPDCFGLLLFDEQEDKKVQRLVRSRHAEYRRLECQRGTARQDLGDHQEQSV